MSKEVDQSYFVQGFLSNDWPQSVLFTISWGTQNLHEPTCNDCSQQTLAQQSKQEIEILWYQTQSEFSEADADFFLNLIVSMMVI